MGIMDTAVMKKIPVEKTWGGNWIKYDGKVLLLKQDPKGTIGNWQWQGVQCSQQSIKGFVVAEFESKSKYFNSEFWYKKTCWMDHENLLFFKTPAFHKSSKIDAETLYSLLLSDKKFKKLEDICRPYSKPVHNVLKAILKEASKKTGLKLELDIVDLRYGRYWGEAYVPVVIDNERYVLTWMNCD